MVIKMGDDVYEKLHKSFFDSAMCEIFVGAYAAKSLNLYELFSCGYSNTFYRISIVS